jgi:hypothetical protein
MPALSLIINELMKQRKDFLELIIKQRKYILYLEKELKEIKEK